MNLSKPHKFCAALIMKKEVFPLAKNKEKAFKPQMMKGSRRAPVLESEAPVDEEMMGKRRVSREGFAWCLYLMGTHLFRMVGLSCLVSMCCATVVLAPAAITGAMRGFLVLLRGRGGLFWADFREEFRDQFGKKLGLWLLLMLLPVAVGLWGYMLGISPSAVKWIVGVGMLLSLVLQSYFMVMTAALELPVETVLKNAVLLLFLEWRTTIVFLMLFAILIAAAYLTFPFCVPLLCFLLIGCIMLLVCQQVRRIILRRGLYLPQEKENVEICEEAEEGDTQ